MLDHPSFGRLLYASASATFLLDHSILREVTLRRNGLKRDSKDQWRSLLDHPSFGRLLYARPTGSHQQDPRSFPSPTNAYLGVASRRSPPRLCLVSIPIVPTTKPLELSRFHSHCPHDETLGARSCHWSVCDTRIASATFFARSKSFGRLLYARNGWPEERDNNNDQRQQQMTSGVLC